MLDGVQLIDEDCSGLTWNFIEFTKTVFIEDVTFFFFQSRLVQCVEERESRVLHEKQLYRYIFVVILYFVIMFFLFCYNLYNLCTRYIYDLRGKRNFIPMKIAIFINAICFPTHFDSIFYGRLTLNN